jgi:hypothetical protein
MVENDEAFVEVVRWLMRKTAETKEPRIADLTAHAINEVKAIPGIVERLLLVSEQGEQQQQPYNPFSFPPPNNRF